MFLSVALCTFNGEKFLKKQLESIINQTIKVNEIIICDDASDDNTVEIIEKIINNSELTIKLFINEDRLGTIKNFEKAISLTKGDLIFLSDQDDIWKINKVERFLNYFEKYSKCLLLFTNASLIDCDNKIIPGSLWQKWGFDEVMQEEWKCNQNQIKSLIVNNNKVTGATLAFKKSLKKDILPMNLPKGIWHDSYMSLMAAKHNGLHYINEPLVKYRLHNAQQVGLNQKASYSNKYAITYTSFRKIIKPGLKKYLSYYDEKFGLKKTYFFIRFIRKLKS